MEACLGSQGLAQSLQGRIHDHTEVDSIRRIGVVGGTLEVGMGIGRGEVGVQVETSSRELLLSVLASVQSEVQIVGAEAQSEGRQRKISTCSLRIRNRSVINIRNISS